MHGLNAPMAADGFREALATEVRGADVVAYLAGFATVGKGYPTHRVADGLDLWPISGRAKAAWDSGEIVRAFVNTTVASFAGLAHTILQVFEVVSDLFVKECFDGILQFGLVVLDRDD